jgi:hypothetical protein
MSEENPEKILTKICKTCRPDKAKQSINGRRKVRRETDPVYKMIQSLRRIFSLTIKAAHKRKLHSSIALLGCEPEYARKYIESQFLEGMSWDNHGKAWHIDHVIPFGVIQDLEDVEDLKKVCHYTNLQPLWKEVNLAKHNKLVDEEWYRERNVIRKRGTI